MLADRARGFTLIEILIAIVVLGFGLLSLARVITRSSSSELEAIQREQAMTIAQDFADRMNLNRRHAAAYVGEYAPDAAPEDCTVAFATQVEADQCAVRNLLRGATTYEGAKAIGAPYAARACVTSPQANVYVIAVAWQGIVPTAAPDSACGAGAFDHEANRRVYSTVVQMATLGA